MPLEISKSLSRSNYLDNICGLLIIHMIFIYHLVNFCKFQVQPYFFVVVSQIFSFFMAWFFFKGGMFYKEKPLRIIIYSGLRRFIIPYVLFNTLGGLCDIFIAYYKQQGNLSISDLLIMPFSVTYYNEATYSNLALWFLLSMVVVKILFSIFYKIKIPILIVCSIFLVLGFLMNHYRYELSSFSLFFDLCGKRIYVLIPYYFGNICYGLAFYSLGYLLKSIQFNKYLFVTCVIIYIIHFIFNDCPQLIL